MKGKLHQEYATKIAIGNIGSDLFGLDETSETEATEWSNNYIQGLFNPNEDLCFHVSFNEMRINNL